MVRCISLSKSMRTGLGGVSADAAAFPPRGRPPSGVARGSPGFSSSLSGASGEATSFARNDQIYTARDLVLIAGHIQTARRGSEVVLAVKYKYWPSLSKAG